MSKRMGIGSSTTMAEYNETKLVVNLLNSTSAIINFNQLTIESPFTTQNITIEMISFHSTTLDTISSTTARQFLVALYCATAVFALLGNGLVLSVNLCHSGHPTFGNISKYLVNLAVSDILLGVFCVPFTYVDTVLGQWIFPHWLCPAAQYVQLLSVFIISMTLSVIGIER